MEAVPGGWRTFYHWLVQPCISVILSAFLSFLSLSLSYLWYSEERYVSRHAPIWTLPLCMTQALGIKCRMSCGRFSPVSLACITGYEKWNTCGTIWHCPVGPDLSLSMSSVMPWYRYGERSPRPSVASLGAQPTLSDTYHRFWGHGENYVLCPCSWNDSTLIIVTFHCLSECNKIYFKKRVIKLY